MTTRARRPSPTFAGLRAHLKTESARALHEELQVVLAFIATTGVLNQELFDGRLSLDLGLSPYTNAHRLVGRRPGDVR